MHIVVRMYSSRPQLNQIRSCYMHARHVHQSHLCESCTACTADCILTSKYPQTSRSTDRVCAASFFRRSSSLLRRVRHERHGFTPRKLVMERACCCRHEPANTSAVARLVSSEAELSGLPVLIFSRTIFVQETWFASPAQWGHRSIGESIWYSQNGSARTQN